MVGCTPCRDIIVTAIAISVRGRFNCPVHYSTESTHTYNRTTTLSLDGLKDCKSSILIALSVLLVWMRGYEGEAGM